jgi:hypothetical protein
VGLVHLLGHHRRELAAPLVRLHQHLVGDHVELLLRLALDVLRADDVADARERALPHRVADHLARAGDHLEQEPELRRDRAGAALLLDQVLR